MLLRLRANPARSPQLAGSFISPRVVYFRPRNFHRLLKSRSCLRHFAVNGFSSNGRSSRILYVTMQPKPGLPIKEFHDWYQNEHGPGRLRLPFFPNGFRYRATDSKEPQWMAVYDVTDMEWLTKDDYTKLRKPPIQSQRERDTMKEILVDRRFYDLEGTQTGSHFKTLEDVEHEGKEGNVMISASITLKDPTRASEYEKWFDEEHVPMLSKVPGWRRTRRFVTSHLEDNRELEIIALHEYAPKNGLDGPEFQAAVNTPWRTQIFNEIVKEKKRRAWELCYTFGPAPRDLSSPNREFLSADKRMKVIPKQDTGFPAIESWVTTPDGVALPFRIEGSHDEHAPLIVLCNSILVDYGIWDGFIREFFGDKRNSKFRVVRYNARGRHSASGSTPVTVDVLASDVVCLLDALRVPKAAAVVGVSLGGATALNVALRFPSRLEAFVSCDTNSMAPPTNFKAWEERVEVAENEGKADENGETVVGESLAEMTVRRWFVEGSYDGGQQEKEINRVKKMVMKNSLQGFKTAVKALYQYDFREKMKMAKVKGMFLVGGNDGILPKTMKEMASSYGDGSSPLSVIENAGHLPMVEQPEKFKDAVVSFLE